MNIECRINRTRKYIIKSRKEKRQRRIDMADRHSPTSLRFTGQNKFGNRGYWNEPFQEEEEGSFDQSSGDQSTCTFDSLQETVSTLDLCHIHKELNTPDSEAENRLNTMTLLLDRLSEEAVTEKTQRQLECMRCFMDPVLVTRTNLQGRTQAQNSIGGNLENLITIKSRVLFCHEDQAIGNVLLTYLRRSFPSMEVHDLVSQGYYGSNLLNYWDSAMKDTRCFLVLMSRAFLNFAQQDAGLRFAFNIIRYSAFNGILLMPIYLEDVPYKDSNWLLDFENRLATKLYGDKLLTELTTLHNWLKITFEGDTHHRYKQFREIILRQLSI